MMFTPTPPARRPRPPGSLNRSRQKLVVVANVRKDPSLGVAVSPGESDTPLKAHLLKRKESELSRIIGSPADAEDVGDVSLTLDMPKVAAGGTSSVLSQSTTSDQAQPSPPPPYGQELPLPLALPADTDGVHTPPRQDSGHPSRRPSSDPDREDVEAMDLSMIEEHLRVSRAAEAARSLGLEMDFDMERSSSQESSASAIISPEGMRRQLREAKQRLRQRDNELLMAAKVADQVLKSHEALLASLPANLQSMSTGVGHHRKSSSTSTSTSIIEEHRVLSPQAEAGPSTTPSHSPTAHRRPIQHVRHRSGPRFSPLTRPARSPSTTLRIYQIESDERIAALGQLLVEAHESEEAQRKQAARLRRDLNKLQREFSAAESRYGADERSIRLSTGARARARLANSGTGEASRRTRIEEAEEQEVVRSLAWSHAGPSRQRSAVMESEEDEEDEDMDEVAHNLSNLSTGTIRRAPISRKSTLEVIPLDEAETSSAASATDASPGPAIRKTSFGMLTAGIGRLRKKLSASSFLSPPKPTRRAQSPGTPTSILLSAGRGQDVSGGTGRTSISIHAPSTRSSKTSKRTPYPSPSPSPLIPAAPDSPSPSAARRLGSFSSRVSSLRLLVGRSLGSELGSAFGDISPAASSTRPAAPSHRGDEDEWTDEEIFSEEGTTPARLPLAASAALSSLALALAPSHVFPSSSSASAPILPRGALREPGLDSGAYELLAEAVKNRKIQWVESTTPPSASLSRSTTSNAGGKGKGKRKSPPTLATRALPLLGNLEWAPVDPWEAGDYPDELSDLGGGSAKRPALWRNASSSSTVALAHRRLHSSQTSSVVEVVLREGEAATIPGKVVNDMVAIVAITLEWIECLAIIFIKVGMDVRYNHRTTISWRRSDGQPRKTYYF